MRGLRIPLAVALALLPAAATAQKGPRCDVARPDTLVVYGAGVPRTVFAIPQLRALPHQEVTTKLQGGATATYRGVPLGVLLGLATGNDKDRLKDTDLRHYLVAEARDGYGVVIALPEADSSADGTAVMVAYEKDGAPLDTVTGPLQLVAPLDQDHGRWVRQLECIRVARDSGR